MVTFTPFPIESQRDVDLFTFCFPPKSPHTKGQGRIGEKWKPRIYCKNLDIKVIKISWKLIIAECDLGINQYTCQNHNISFTSVPLYLRNQAEPYNCAQYSKNTFPTIKHVRYSIDNVDTIDILFFSDILDIYGGHQRMVVLEQ